MHLGSPHDLKKCRAVRRPDHATICAPPLHRGGIIARLFLHAAGIRPWRVDGGLTAGWSSGENIAEYAICGLLWGTLFGLAAIYDGWQVLLIGYFVPVVIAGNLQSLRKFTEHMGLCGDTILSTTRTVVDRRWFGRLMSDSMLHIDYHGTHHRYAKVPHYNLPAATPLVYKPGQPAVPIFSSYSSAMLDMLWTLHDPRVGRQWLANQDAQLGSA